MARSRFLIIALVVLAAVLAAAAGIVIAGNGRLDLAGAMGRGSGDKDRGAGATGSGATSGGNVSVQCDEGNSGTLQVPLVGARLVNSDQKHHWDMPSNITTVVATLTWQDTSWELEFSIGTGDCPDNGVAKASTSGSGGSLTIEYGEEQLEEGQWFAHVRCPSPESKRGQSCEYQLEITLSPASSPSAGAE